MEELTYIAIPYPLSSLTRCGSVVCDGVFLEGELLSYHQEEFMLCYLNQITINSIALKCSHVT